MRSHVPESRCRPPTEAGPVTQYLQAQCPQCQHELRVRAEYLNQRVVCKHCQQAFTVTGAAPSPARAEALEQELRQAQAALDAVQAERRTALEGRDQAQTQLRESEAALEQARHQLQQ